VVRPFPAPQCLSRRDTRDPIRQVGSLELAGHVASGPCPPDPAARRRARLGTWTRKGGQLHALAPSEALGRIIAIRVQVDDRTNNNGPVRVLPRTHERSRLPDARMAVLAQEVPQVECVVRAGGVIVMSPLLVHASSKSASGLPRRVVHIEYATSEHLGFGIELAVGSEPATVGRQSRR
jgi:hypothetical protein